LRIAREMTGGWYPWSINPGNKEDHKSGWARIVNTMKDAGFTGKFHWNPFIGKGTFGSTSYGPERAYPDNDTVDVISIDFYDGGYPGPAWTDRPTATCQAHWNTFLNQYAGLTGWRQWGAWVNRPLAFPEWGLLLWSSNGCGDNPVLINGMADWLDANPAYMHAIWEDNLMGVSAPDGLPGRWNVPNARRAFLNRFGFNKWSFPKPDNLTYSNVTHSGYRLHWSPVRGPNGEVPSSYTVRTYRSDGKQVDLFTTALTSTSEYGQGGHGLPRGSYHTQVWANGGPVAPKGSDIWVTIR
jgi:hypothetical protein